MSDLKQYGPESSPTTDWHFCTSFDSGYLPAGVALYESLAETLPSLDLWVLCLDETAYDLLESLDLNGIHPVELAELELFDPELSAVENNRTAAEYYFTCKSAFVNYLFETAAPLGITYLDSDLYFFRSPAELRLEERDTSVLVHSHNFPSNRGYIADRVGRYNAGFISVRNDETGRRCIEDWRERCLDWCYDRVEDGKFADQKYLDDWPDRWNADIIHNPGVGTARWNLERWSFSVYDDTVFVDDDPLVFYHFEALQRLSERVWNPHASLPPTVEHHIYRPYICHRMRVQQRIQQQTGQEVDDRTYRLGLVARGHGPVGDLVRTLYRTANTLWAGVSGNLLYVRTCAGGTDAD